MVSKKYVQRMKLKRRERIEIEDKEGNCYIGYFHEIQMIGYDDSSSDKWKESITMLRHTPNERDFFGKIGIESDDLALDFIKEIRRLEIIAQH